MTDLTRDDLRAAVTTGAITEAQAAAVIAVSQTRAGQRARFTGQDEPFELFKGFNEIFIVVGLTILFMGWLGVTGLGIFSAATTGYLWGMALAVAAMAGVAALAQYFTRVRRMVAPSIALTVMFALSAFQFGVGFSAMLNTGTPGALAVAFGITAVLGAGFYAVFRVPFAVAIVALSVFGCAFGLATLGGEFPDTPMDIFLLSADGPFAVLTIVLGGIGLAIALVFDMSDPHRVTRRASAAFWLHIIAAPAIVNTVALTLFDMQMPGAQAILLVFLTLMAVFAVVIDRRSFLVAGVGYVVALAFTVIEGGAFWAILILGLALVLLGAQWETLRRLIMRALPAFPGKDRLPPYDIPLDEGPVT